MFATFRSGGDLPLIAAAIHAGNEVRPEIAAVMALDDETRRREEDGFTELLITEFPTRVEVHRSRFEVDINRPRDEAVYGGPDDAWGLDIWERPLTSDEIERSLQLHDNFYSDLQLVLDHLMEQHGGFVLYDVHSYNHRREGPDRPPEDPADNPAVNLGTGSMPDRWRPVAEEFLETLKDDEVDARENVKFKGRRLAEYVHENYGDAACALAIEFRKDYVDEWTDRLQSTQLEDLKSALGRTVKPVITSWRQALGS